MMQEAAHQQQHQPRGFGDIKAKGTEDASDLVRVETETSAPGSKDFHTLKPFFEMKI